jgi:hypothetical protein
MTRALVLLAIGAATVGLGVPQALAAASATTTTLSLASAGKAVTSVESGTLITLTATVKASTTPVTLGQVNFCDATAVHCTDIHILGTADLTNSGTAVVKLTPGVGSHSYKAVFVGTTGNATSVSSVSKLTVTGTFPTTTAIASSGQQGDYTITATVGSTGGTVSPTGTLSLLDTSNSKAVLGKATLSPGISGLSFYTFSSPATGTEPVSVATGDFNGDGKPTFLYDWAGSASARQIAVHRRLYSATCWAER